MIKKSGFTKVLLSPRFLETIQYEHAPAYIGKHSKGGRKRERTVSPEAHEANRRQAIRTATNNIRQYLDHNFRNTEAYFITLTVRKDVSWRFDLSEAKDRFERYRRAVQKRLRKWAPGYTLNYLAVPETTKKGTVHFHMVTDAPPHIQKHLRAAWTHGRYSVTRIWSDKSLPRLANYLCKQFRDRPPFKKLYFKSNLLYLPQKLYDDEAYDYLRNIPLDTSMVPLVYKNYSHSEYLGEIVHELWDTSRHDRHVDAEVEPL
ncbi:hypothetical protein [Alicyclobacillus acidoterrestris]|uniref:Replication-associated protein ORF2/G2P domain-containing protein n=1 Tax=Alicyclobacillus acidoterrestris (strain ATCC 49025 / DSM 3922 / CIP 106132 / NCIMB 13137 / GD3B) TaxID=1356854 RepID=T0BIW7_ALIAG|nr:hypothetical protein [Alicyclobacillus acidoterrestris]EPZ40659.1 hypothetical protein N007_17875 [Alicyclobacillus acidoterrestris ATCC 49025]UNO49051.1 hypothetical protein K1I37_00300 [Alicyclobacillus acidoterrestris]